MIALESIGLGSHSPADDLERIRGACGFDLTLHHPGGIHTRTFRLDRNAQDRDGEIVLMKALAKGATDFVNSHP